MHHLGLAALNSALLIWAPGLGAAVLPDELCSFRLKKEIPVPCIYIQLCYSRNLGCPHSPGYYQPPIR